VVVSEAVAEAGGATITSTMTKVKRQIAIAVEDAVEEDMDVVVEAEESNAITVRHLDIMHQTAKAS
jgi:predicted dinucleotide-utilizing enzyme